MKKLVFSFAFVLFVLVPWGEALAQQGCLTAMDCPGGQLCQMGKCVPAGGAAPAPAAPAPAPAYGGCVTDVDCPGNQVCENGSCVAESAPPPAPSPVPGPPPSSGYGAPASAPPASGYGTPGTAPPASGYGTPGTGTAPPESGYGAPASGYGTPGATGANTTSGYDSAPAAPQGLQLTSGTMQLGGRLALSYEHVDDGHGYVNGAMLDISPAFGYFVADNFELLIGLLVAKGFGEIFEGYPADAGATIGIAYYFAFGEASAFYIGAQVGMQFTIPEEGDTYKWFVAAVPIGVLIGLNSHVAIDIGLRPQFMAGLDEPKIKQISAPIGYLGVQAFF